MIYFTLKRKWYGLLKTYKKHVDYREVKPYWTKRFATLGMFPKKDIPYQYKKEDGFPVTAVFQLGCDVETRFARVIERIEIVDGKDTDLHVDRPVYAIHLFKGFKEQLCAYNVN